ncbi:MAG: Asp23/Gls24 family envelope stress response protein [Bacilli bacterium]|nr:Asp23/Gls24 family envelope stress response protein [Bacilli bacterium]
MAIKRETKFGEIELSLEAIASVAGEAATECYGVAGLSNKRTIKDNIYEILKKEDYVKGVAARPVSNTAEVDVYVILAYGVKVTEVAAEIQKRVKYVLEKTFQMRFKAVNVFVQDVQIIG